MTDDNPLKITGRYGDEPEPVTDEEHERLSGCLSVRSTAQIAIQYQKAVERFIDSVLAEDGR
jgi:hypothetical protein